MPLLEPVMITVRDVRSGMSSVVKVVTDNNVVNANNDVNDYICR